MSDMTLCAETVRQAAVQARTAISNTVVRTPLVHSPTFSRMFGGEIYLKLENLQKTGSFKIRGAANKLFKIREQIGPGGVVAASAGNHAQGVALAARHAGVASTIVMPEWASISKQEATRGYGGSLVIFGRNVEESLQKAGELAQEGRIFIHPFDDADIIAGQGTVALEMFEELKDIDTILAPIGGGGLISGISAVAKAIRPGVKVIGVQAAVCPSAFESLRNGKLTKVEAEVSVADGISVKQPGNLTFDFIQKYADDVVLVGEDHIAAAILMLLERKKILAEGAGAVPLAALLNGSVRVPPGSKTVLVISGGNLDSPLLGRIISKGMVKNGRIMRFRVHLKDIPGSLSQLLDRIADLKANVLHIYHDRNVKGIPINISCVELELETRSSDHIDEIYLELQTAGYEIIG